jgi:prophage regulatory protein
MNDNKPSLISLNDTAQMTSMSRTMINRLRSENRFPVAVKLDICDNAKRIAFIRSEVHEWIKSRIDARAAA